MKLERIGLIGYGEVGKIFSAGLRNSAGVTGVGAWDLKFAQAATQATERAHAAQAGIDAHGCMQALCEASELILSAVTASPRWRWRRRPRCSSAPARSSWT